MEKEKLSHFNMFDAITFSISCAMFPEHMSRHHGLSLRHCDIRDPEDGDTAAG